MSEIVERIVRYILGSSLLVMALWLWMLARGSAVDKATWLLVPVTGIYIIVSGYMALAALRAAQANEKAVAVMRDTLAEMQLSRAVEHLPVLGFPRGHLCGLPANGNAYLELRSLCPVPILGLHVALWELEQCDGSVVPKYSSMRESAPTDYPVGTDRIEVAMERSPRPDEEKRSSATSMMQEFRNRFKKPPANSLCAVSFSTRSSPMPLLYLYDCELQRPAGIVEP